MFQNKLVSVLVKYFQPSLMFKEGQNLFTFSTILIKQTLDLVENTSTQWFISIIDIRAYETFSTLIKVSFSRSACASLHF